MNCYQCLGFKCKLPSQEGPNMGFLYVYVLFPNPNSILASNWCFISLHLSSKLYSSLTLVSKLPSFYKISISIYESYLCILLFNFQKQILFCYLQIFMWYMYIWAHVNGCNALFICMASDMKAETNMVHQYNLFSNLTFIY